MCLHYIRKMPEKYKNKRIVYQVKRSFEDSFFALYYAGGGVLHYGETVISNKFTRLGDCDCKKYQTGFHCFPELKNARKYLSRHVKTINKIIVKCRISKPRLYGTQFRLGVLIADKITFLEEVK